MGKRWNNRKGRRPLGRRRYHGYRLKSGVSLAVISLGEIRKAFEGLEDKYPPILDLERAAGIAGLAPSTLRRKVSEGCFKDSVSRKKPLRFWRNRFVQEVMK